MKKSISIGICLCILAFINVFGIFAQTRSANWDYPIKPGTDEWKGLHNSFQKIQSCQVPQSVLSTLSTQRLIELCLTYPLLRDILVFNNIQDGFLKYENDFNGFKELLKRNDAAFTLIQNYRNSNPAILNGNLSDYVIGDSVIRISMIELFLSHNNIGQLISFEKRELIKELQLKIDQKNANPELFQNLGLQTTYLAIIKLLESENFDYSKYINQERLIPFIYEGLIIDPKITRDINEATLSYLIK